MRHDLDRRSVRPCSPPLAVFTLPVSSGAQSPATPAIDAEYTARIRELTPTDPKWKFTTELVDYLPASATVPTPLKVLGYVPGTVGQAVARRGHQQVLPRARRGVAGTDAPRVVRHERRESRGALLAVADEETIRRLDEYRAMTARLADPRGHVARRARAPDSRGEADLLGARVDPLAGDGQPRDADGARVPNGRRRRRVHARAFARTSSR